MRPSRPLQEVHSLRCRVKSARTQLTRLWKSEVHAAGAGIGPTAGDHFAAGVELHALRTVNVEIAEERGLPTAEAVVGHGHGDRDVDANHAGFHIELEL